MTNKTSAMPSAPTRFRLKKPAVNTFQTYECAPYVLVAFMASTDSRTGKTCLQRPAGIRRTFEGTPQGTATLGAGHKAPLTHPRSEITTVTPASPFATVGADSSACGRSAGFAGSSGLCFWLWSRWDAKIAGWLHGQRREVVIHLSFVSLFLLPPLSLPCPFPSLLLSLTVCSCMIVFKNSAAFVMC